MRDPSGRRGALATCLGVCATFGGAVCAQPPDARAQPGSGEAAHAGDGDAPSLGDAIARDTGGVAHVGAYWENDGSWVKPFLNDDRYYTNGIRVDLSFAPRAPGPVLAGLGSLLGYEAPRAAFGLRASHLMHTPDDITVTTPQPLDHPWSGHIGIASYAQLAEDAGSPGNGGVARMDHLEVEVGWVGERTGAAGLQTFVHAAAPDQVMPRGWSNQLSNEVTIGFAWERRWRLLEHVIAFGRRDRAEAVPASEFRGVGWDLTASVGLVAGTPRVSGHVGVGYRVGWNLPGDFGAARIESSRDATWDTLRLSSDAERGPWSVYGFVEATGRAVAWDLYIEGNALAAGPDGVSATAWVGDLFSGVAVRYRWFEFAWGLTFETERFEGQDGGHSYGTWRFGASFAY